MRREIVVQPGDGWAIMYRGSTHAATKDIDKVLWDSLIDWGWVVVKNVFM